MCSWGCKRAHGGCFLDDRGDRVSTRRETNRLLAAVMAEAEMSNKGLAARVRALALQGGHPIAPDHVSVRRWLDGTLPRRRTADFIALALSAKLHRAVTPADLGLDGAQHDAGIGLADDGTRYPDTSGDAVQSLNELAAADLDDQPVARLMRWSSAAAAEAITSYLFGLSDGITIAAQRRGEPLTAAAIRGTAAHLMDLDFAYGGGHVRRLLLFYITSEVVPVLRQSGPEPVRRELYSAAAEVVLVLGWSAYDAGRHGAAQRYFILGLRLAREGHDHLLCGRALAELSDQANYLGKFGDAAQLARAAQSATQGNSSATVGAMCVAREARALASSGDERGCAKALNKAETLFARRATDTDPEWMRYFNAAELAADAAHCFRDLGRPAQACLFADQALHSSAVPPRSRALRGMVKAAGVLAGGDADEAVALALAAVDLAGPLKSNRYVRTLTDFYWSLAADRSASPYAGAFAARVIGVYPRVQLPHDA